MPKFVDHASKTTQHYLNDAKRASEQEQVHWAVGGNASDVLRHAERAKAKLGRAIERLRVHTSD